MTPSGPLSPNGNSAPLNTQMGECLVPSENNLVELIKITFEIELRIRD